MLNRKWHLLLPVPFLSNETGTGQLLSRLTVYDSENVTKQAPENTKWQCGLVIFFKSKRWYLLPPFFCLTNPAL
jgi:hypothetical protein